jgi:hypothetical protein
MSADLRLTGGRDGSLGPSRPFSTDGLSDGGRPGGATGNTGSSGRGPMDPTPGDRNALCAVAGWLALAGGRLLDKRTARLVPPGPEIQSSSPRTRWSSPRRRKVTRLPCRLLSTTPSDPSAWRCRVVQDWESPTTAAISVTQSGPFSREATMRYLDDSPTHESSRRLLESGFNIA